MACGWEGNRGPGVALAVRHRPQWFIHLRAQDLSKGDEHRAYSLLGVCHALGAYCFTAPYLKFQIRHWSTGLPRATAECDYVTASKHLYSRQLIGESHHGRSTSSRRVVDTLSRRDMHILQGYVRLYRVVAAGHVKRRMRRRVGEGRDDPCHLRSPARVACLYTHPFNGPFSGTTQVSRYQKGKTNLDFTEARDSEWQRHQLGHMQNCTSLQTDNHASTPPLSFLQAGCPSCRPTKSVKALKAQRVACLRDAKIDNDCARTTPSGRGRVDSSIDHVTRSYTTRTGRSHGSSSK